MVKNPFTFVMFERDVRKQQSNSPAGDIMMEADFQQLLWTLYYTQ